MFFVVIHCQGDHRCSYRPNALVENVLLQLIVADLPVAVCVGGHETVAQVLNRFFTRAVVQLTELVISYVKLGWCRFRVLDKVPVITISRRNVRTSAQRGRGHWWGALTPILGSDGVR